MKHIASTLWVSFCLWGKKEPSTLVVKVSPLNRTTHSALWGALTYFSFLEIPTGSCFTFLCTWVIKKQLNGASGDFDVGVESPEKVDKCSCLLGALVLLGTEEEGIFPCIQCSCSKPQRERDFPCFCLHFMLDCLCVPLSKLQCGENCFNCFPRKPFDQNLDWMCHKGRSRESK